MQGMLANGIELNGNELNKFRLGDDATLEIASAEALVLVTNHLAREAVRYIDIYSRDLEPPIYDYGLLVDSVRRLCISQGRARVRVIVQNPERAVRHGHGLVRLAQRLPSFIEIRQPAPEHHTNNFAMMIVDEIASIYREMGDRYEAEVHFGDRMQARALSGRFEAIWHSATQPPDLRRLSL